MNTAGNTERQPLHTGSAGHALSANIQSDDIKKGGGSFFPKWNMAQKAENEESRRGKQDMGERQPQRGLDLEPWWWQ